MRTVRTKVYKFEELSEDAKQVAIEICRNKDEISLDYFYDNAKEQIENAGFYDDIRIEYSLSYSQGDGLSFSCNKIDEKILLSFFLEILGSEKEKTAKAILDNCSFKNTGNNGRYCYASKSDIDYSLESYKNDYQNINEIVTKVCENIESLYIELCKDLENQGYSDIEYQRSDEFIIESLIDNDQDYLANGKQFNN
jgi:hypothetical protein